MDSEVGVLTTITNAAGTKLVKELLGKEEIALHSYVADATPDNHFTEYTVVFTNEKMIVLNYRVPRRVANSTLYLVDSTVVPRSKFLVYFVTKPNKQAKSITLELWCDGFSHWKFLFAVTENIADLVKYIEENAVVTLSK